MTALIDSLNHKAANLCKHIVRMCTVAGSGHPSSALSLVHMVTALMYHKMRYDLANPWNSSSDRLVLSEGHAVPVIYAAYADLNGVVGKNKADTRKLTLADLDSLRLLDSVLDGHPNPAEGFPFFDAATGSLGQGLSVSAGLALAARGVSDRIIYCICGDGESREGQVWEAVDFIAEKQLNSVVLIFNCNGQGQSDYVAPQQSPKALAAKLAAAGWNTRIINGHNIKEFLDTLNKNMGRGKPLAICAKTVKGWGSSVLSKGNWHGKPLPAADLDRTMRDFDKIIARLQRQGAKLDNGRLRPPKPAKTTRRPAPKKTSLGDPLVILSRDKAYSQKGKIATRRAFGLALVALGRVNKNVVALDGDVKNSTFSIYFYQKYPDRFFECRIAEQNMLSTAVGLSAAGKIPFVNSFGKFLARSYDQLELAVIGRANIKIVASHSGVTLGADGPSQMSLPDVAYFASMTTARREDGSPICVLFQPADGVAAVKMTELMANHQGLCYMRTHRPDTNIIYGKDDQFEIGRTKTVLKGKDIAIFAAGYMVHESIAAAGLLKKAGIKASVLDAYSLPINADEVIKAAKANNNKILTVEDNFGHSMGSAVAHIAAANGRIIVKSLTLPKLPKSARDINKLLKYLSLDARTIAARAKQMLS